LRLLRASKLLFVQRSAKAGPLGVPAKMKNACPYFKLLMPGMDGNVAAEFACPFAELTIESADTGTEIRYKDGRTIYALCRKDQAHQINLAGKLDPPEPLEFPVLSQLAK
jgi:hypothetical protein